MTWLEIVDSAIKIGLGALIAGGITFATARAKSKSDKEARQEQRRSEHLLALLEMLSEVENLFQHHKWRLDSYRFYKEQDRNEEAEKERIEFEKLDDPVRISLDRFFKASSILLLIGEEETDKLLWVYHGAINEWLGNVVLDTEHFSKEERDRINDSIRTAKKSLFTSLAKAYS